MEGHLKESMFEDQLQQYIMMEEQNNLNLQNAIQTLSDEQRVFGEGFAANLRNNQINSSIPVDEERDEQDGNSSSLKKKYHRHTEYQIQRLEEYFRECSHPDEIRRRDLSRELDLDPLRIKFWFQNKRHKLKTQNDREENQRMKELNESLKAENLQLKEALSSLCCPNCSGPNVSGTASSVHPLYIENSRLYDEIARMNAILAIYSAQQMGSYPNWSAGTSSAPNEFGI